MTTKIKLANNVADVDLTTTAPTNGQGLIYNSTSSKWVPGAAGGGVTTYDTIDDLPLSGVSTGALALVDSTNKLYLWMDTGWYNIATINTNPSITGGNDTPYLLATDGTPTEITLIASDPEGIPLTWSYEVTSGSLTNGGGTTATVSNVDNVFTVTPTTTEAYAGAFSLTFKASDGVNLGTTVAAFTLAFRISDSNYTTLLAKGVAATQNATFVDSSTNAHTITANGDVYQGTFSPYRGGGYSMYFDGTGDYLTAAYGADLSLDADFTIELWVYPISKVSNFPTLVHNYSSYGTNGGFSIFAEHNSGTAGKYNVSFNGSFPVINSTDSVAYGQWQHVALVRSGTTLTLYVDGVANGSSTQSATVIGTSDYWWIGASGDALANSGLNGNISNLRVVKGTAVYTANFTPPTSPLEAITSTSLLINTPYIADSSSNGHAITVNGNTSTQPFSPFNYKVYDEAINGGSAYFDGTGDVLYAAENTAFNVGVGDFTFESWIYPTSFTTDDWNTVFSVGNTTNFGGLLVGKSNTNTFCIRQYGTATPVETATLPPLNSWTHIACVRSSGTSTLYYNGVAVASATDSTNYTTATPFAHVGNSDHTTYAHYFNGYISNPQLVKGTAVYTSNFTPPTAPLEAIPNTSLLLNFTNAGIQDYSQVSDLKLIGNATGSNTQVKNASYSMYFDGTGDYLTVEPSDGFKFGTGDFTIEAWVYPTATLTTNRTILDARPADTANKLNNYYMLLASNVLRFVWADISAEVAYDTTATLTQNTWHYVTVSKSGSSLRLYVDGVWDSTHDVTGKSFNSALFNIGYKTLTESGINYWIGYIEDLRITKGLARYTTETSFTPPTSELLG